MSCFSPAKAFRVLLCATAAVCLSATMAAAQLPMRMQGPLTAVASDGGTGATVVVLGSVIQVPATAVVHSPTAPLTLAQLLDATPLPGRTQAGFLGGIATANGTIDPVTGVMTATDLLVDPAEAVILGAVTANGANLVVNGVPVVLMSDPRIPGTPLQNDLGFPITAASVTVGKAASILGYPSTDGSGLFQAFNVTITGVAAANPGLQAAITRNIGNAKALTLDLRGGIAGLPTTGAITVQVFSGTKLLATATATRDPLIPTQASFRFAGKVPAPFPTSVFVKVTAAGFPAVPGPTTKTVNSPSFPVQ